MAAPSPSCPLRLASAIAVWLLLVGASLAQANSPPVFPGIPDPSAFEGTTATVDAAATDPDGDPLSYSAVGPTWLSIDVNTGLCTLKPDYAAAQAGGGLYPVTVEANDGTAIATTNFTVHALDVPTVVNLADANVDMVARYKVETLIDQGALVAKSLTPLKPAFLEGHFREVQGLDATYPVGFSASDCATPLVLFDASGGQSRGDEDYFLAASGEATFHHGRPDLWLGGPMPLHFSRYYASIRAWDGDPPGPFGTTSWSSNYSWRLSVTPAEATVVSPRGRVYRFQSAGPGVWALVSPTDAPYQLVQAAAEPFTFAAQGVVEGEVIVCRFDPGTLLLAQIEDAHGNVHFLTYTGGLLSQVSDGLGRALTFSHDLQGRLIGLSDGTRSVSYAYDAITGELAEFHDALSQTTHYSYAPGPVPGLLTSVTLPGGNTPLTVAYDLQQGRLLFDTDPSGATRTFGALTQQSPLGVLATISTPSGGVWQEQWDSQQRLRRRTDPASGVTAFSYDAAGRVQSHSRPAGDTRQFTYDPSSGKPSTITLPDGTTRGFGYSPRNVGALVFYDLSDASYPDGSTAQWNHDAAGNVIQHRDRAGQTWSYSHNARGQVTQATIPGGGTWQYGYDPPGRLASITNPSANTTSFQYDALDRLVRVVHPDLNHRDYGYDPLNRPTSVTNELSKAWTIQWTPNGWLRSVRDPLLHETQLAYDTMDRLSSWTDALGAAVSYGYDPSGRLATVTDRTLRTTTYGYDNMDRLTSATDPGANTMQLQYDANSRLMRVTDPLTHARQFAWDGLDRLTRYTDARESVTQLTYDAVAREIRILPPLGDNLTLTYDSRGMLSRKRFGNPATPSAEIRYTYAPWGDLLTCRDPNGNLWSYGYDPGARQISSTDPLGRLTSYGYDSRNRMTLTTTPTGTIAYGYDAASRLTSRTLGAGPVLNYSYDDANRLSGGTGISLARDAVGRVTSSQGVAYAYDGEGRLTGITLAPGRTLTYTYDPRGLPSTVQDWMGGTTQLVHDAAGNLTLMFRPNGTHAAYEYDAMDHPTRIADARADTIVSVSLGRNAIGNPVSAVRKAPHPVNTSAGSSNFAYDAAGQVIGYNYDGNGRLLSGGGRSYQWDLGSRLLQLNQASGPVTYAYDAADRMTGRADPSTGPRTLVWNEAAGGLQVERQGATDMRYYVAATTVQTENGWLRAQVPIPSPSSPPDHYGGWQSCQVPSKYENYEFPGAYLYSIDPATGNREFYHADESGNVVAVSNNAGSVDASYRYDAYGRASSLGLTAANPLTFRGAHGAYREGPGLYRMGGDLYDAETARFVCKTRVDSWVAVVERVAPVRGLSHIDSWASVVERHQSVPPHRLVGLGVGTNHQFGIASGQTSPETVFIAWFTSPGHSRNMVGDWLAFEVSKEWVEMFGDTPAPALSVGGRWSYPYGGSDALFPQGTSRLLDPIREQDASFKNILR